MGFANDKNGNSVPDDQESAFDADAANPCLPVWPYGGGGCGNDQNCVNDCYVTHAEGFSAAVLLTDCAATTCAHANQETMGTFTPGYRGLVCAFHLKFS